jgi:hypothetical protein
MNDILSIAAQNTIVAGVLDVVVYALTRVRRRPPVAHVLWSLVLAKLGRTRKNDVARRSRARRPVQVSEHDLCGQASPPA